MVDRHIIFPPLPDNTYRGRKIALLFFYLITTITIVRSAIHICLPDGGAQSIATIPMNSYPPEASATLILIFSYWGISQLIIGLLYLLVAARYKSLVPLMYILLFAEYSLRLLLGHLKPIHTTGTPPGAVANYVMVPLSLLLFFLSVNGKEK